MKLCHAAALALTGWYLMTPPGREGKILYNAPLAQWGRENAGDTEAQCRTNIETVLRMADLIEKADPEASEKWEAVRAAECISTDDPRLKPN
jgi:hypothetical protein